MSDISGKGFGSSHDWKRVGEGYMQKYTQYTCAACGWSFFHHYDHVPPIFEALAFSDVPDNCPNQTVA